jgi:hypothetical protein
LQRRFGLLPDTDLASGRRALLFFAPAWVPLVLLARVQGLALNDQNEPAVPLFWFLLVR